MGLNGGNVVGNFPCTGMHGGKMLIRSSCKDVKFPKNVHVKRAEKCDLDEFHPYIKEFCDKFGYDVNDVLNAEFTVLSPDTNNPYKQMYVPN